jgi:hypothetical protein
VTHLLLFHVELLPRYEFASSSGRGALVQQDSKSALGLTSAPARLTLRKKTTPGGVGSEQAANAPAAAELIDRLTRETLNKSRMNPATSGSFRTARRTTSLSNAFKREAQHAADQDFGAHARAYSPDPDARIALGEVDEVAAPEREVPEWMLNLINAKENHGQALNDNLHSSSSRTLHDQQSSFVTRISSHNPYAGSSDSGLINLVRASSSTV